MPDYAQRFRTTLELHDAGVQMMHLKFRRKHPEASEEQIRAWVVEWLMARPEEIPDHRRIPWPRS